MKVLIIAPFKWTESINILFKELFEKYADVIIFNKIPNKITYTDIIVLIECRRLIKDYKYYKNKCKKLITYSESSSGVSNYADINFYIVHKKRYLINKDISKILQVPWYTNVINLNIINNKTPIIIIDHENNYQNIKGESPIDVLISLNKKELLIDNTIEIILSLLELKKSRNIIIKKICTDGFIEIKSINDIKLCDMNKKIDRAEYLKELSNGDIFVTTHKESLGLTCLEAAKYGLTVVVSNKKHIIHKYINDITNHIYNNIDSINWNNIINTINKQKYIDWNNIKYLDFIENKLKNMKIL